MTLAISNGCAPASRAQVMKVWRKVWGVTRASLAFLAALATGFFSDR